MPSILSEINFIEPMLRKVTTLDDPFMGSKLEEETDMVVYDEIYTKNDLD